MRRWGCLVAALTMAPLLAHAAEWTTVTKDNSKIRIDAIPGMESARIIYQYHGWDESFSSELSHAGAFVNGANYPRLQIYLQVLAPSHIWTKQDALDEKWIRSLSPFFKDRALHVLNPEAGGGSAAVRKVRFDVDHASCAGFAVGGIPASGPVEGFAAGHNARTSGYYCAAEGKPLSDVDVQTVLSKISITERLDQARGRLVPPPADAAANRGQRE